MLRNIQVKVFDLDLTAYIEVKIDIAYGLLIGYSTPEKQKINPDISSVEVDNFYISHFENNDFKNLSSILEKCEIKLLNASDVYEISLKGRKLYHLKDLDDGDFIGMDMDKKIYKITHDPFEIIELDGTLAEVI